MFGLVEIKGKPETLQQLAKHWLERDQEFRDLEFLLEHGGEDWLFNNLMTGPTHGINPSSVEARVAKFGSNKRKRMKPQCRLAVTQHGGNYCSRLSATLR